MRTHPQKIYKEVQTLELWLSIVLIAAAALVGVVIGFLVRKSIAEKKIGSAEEQAKRILEDAIKNAENVKKESIISAKEETTASFL